MFFLDICTRKKFLFVMCLIWCGQTLFSQQESQFVFVVHSKYQTNVEIDITVKYGGEIAYSQKDLIVRRIHAAITDSLVIFDAVEMYTVAKPDMQRIIENSFKSILQKKQIEFSGIVLNSVKIPEELRLLYEKYKAFEK